MPEKSPGANGTSKPGAQQGEFRDWRQYPDGQATDFLMMIKAGTPTAIALKQNRIPFKVEQQNTLRLSGDGSGKEGELGRLIATILGKTFLVVSDKKRLSDGPWLERFEGRTTADKFAFVVKKIFNSIAPGENALVFTGIKGRRWALSGYLLKCDSREDYERLHSMLDKAEIKYRRE